MLAVGIFEDWQRVPSVKSPILEVGGVFKEYELDKVQPLTQPITEMDTLTLNYWLSKFCSAVSPCHGRRKKFLRMWIWILGQSVLATLRNVL